MGRRADAGDHDQQVHTTARPAGRGDQHQHDRRDHREHDRPRLGEHRGAGDQRSGADRRGPQPAGLRRLGQPEPRPDPHHEQACGAVDVAHRRVEPALQEGAAASPGGELRRQHERADQRRQAEHGHHRACRRTLADREQADREQHRVDRDLVGTRPGRVARLPPEDRGEAQHEQQPEAGSCNTTEAGGARSPAEREHDQQHDGPHAKRSPGGEAVVPEGERRERERRRDGQDDQVRTVGALWYAAAYGARRELDNRRDLLGRVHRRRASASPPALPSATTTTAASTIHSRPEPDPGLSTL